MLNLSGFLPGSRASYSVSSTKSGQLITDILAVDNTGTGNVSVSSNLLAPGPYNCSVEEPSSRRVLATSFTVTAPTPVPASLSVSSKTALPGTSLVISGKGFSPNNVAAYSVFFSDTRTLIVSATTGASADGQISVTLNTKGYDPGSYVVEFQDSLTNQQSSVTFELAPVKPESWLPYSDNLSNPGSGTKTTLMRGLSSTGDFTSGGGFAITLKADINSNNCLAWISNPKLKNVSDFKASVEGHTLTEYVDKVYYGLIFRYTDPNNYYVFLVDPRNGTWSLRQMVNGKYAYVSNVASSRPTYSSFDPATSKATDDYPYIYDDDIVTAGWYPVNFAGIGPNPNVFEVTCKGNNTTVSLNNRVVMSSNSSTLGQGLVGPVIVMRPYFEGPATVVFSNFTIDLPPASP
jgi:hypothetical protein